MNGYDPKPGNIQTLLADRIPSTEFHQSSSGKKLTPVLLDFDSGKAAPFNYRAFTQARLLQRNSIDASEPIPNQQGHMYTRYFCDFYCINKLDFLGKINGEKVRIQSAQVPMTLWGQPSNIRFFVMPPDRRSNGYSVLRAITTDGKIKWEKVYLIQSDGTYTSPNDEPGASNVVETIFRVEYMLPNDDYFYLQNHTENAFRFGPLTMRVRFETGMPLTDHARIKAVNLDEFQAVLNEAVVEIERHYRKSDTTSKDSYEFVTQPEDTVSSYRWKRDFHEDIPLFINFKIQQHWFKEFIK